jgi:hypothetical protein
MDADKKPMKKIDLNLSIDLESYPNIYHTTINSDMNVPTTTISTLINKIITPYLSETNNKALF